MTGVVHYQKGERVSVFFEPELQQSLLDLSSGNIAVYRDHPGLLLGYKGEMAMVALENGGGAIIGVPDYCVTKP